MQSRHLHRGLAYVSGKGLHGLQFAMDKEGAVGLAGSSMPGQEFLLVGMGGEPSDGVDLGVDLDLFVQYPHNLFSLDNTASQRAPAA